MKILIVEDDPAEVELALEAFSEVDASYEVNSVDDGIEALAYLRGGQPRPDLVLLDLNMPRKDGRETLQELRADAELGNLPVIVLSNSDAPDDVEFVYRNHGNSYIVKPIDMHGMYELVRVIKRFWGGELLGAC